MRHRMTMATGRHRRTSPLQVMQPKAPYLTSPTPQPCPLHLSKKGSLNFHPQLMVSQVVEVNERNMFLLMIPTKFVKEVSAIKPTRLQTSCGLVCRPALTGILTFLLPRPLKQVITPAANKADPSLRPTFPTWERCTWACGRHRLVTCNVEDRNRWCAERDAKFAEYRLFDSAFGRLKKYMFEAYFDKVTKLLVTIVPDNLTRHGPDKFVMIDDFIAEIGRPYQYTTDKGKHLFVRTHCACSPGFWRCNSCMVDHVRDRPKQ